MNRRNLIQMTDDERGKFLADARTITLSTIDQHGYPHSVAMWYVMDGDCALMTTYAKSQKTRNIERNPKVGLMAESGATYDALKGVLIRGRADLIREEDRVLAVLKQVHAKMMGSFPEGIDDALRAQARKRVVVRVVPDRVSSWDHTKLAGVY
ncbi:MAG TPA: pyridoxamine 5'-phosphate oxidase family protein [Candidatus Acidoferrales bacterium]|nr:pyridoxamine 5'-phosphate oxidase family protein [Candidatus Acidoferrales bacterium]